MSLRLLTVLLFVFLLACATHKLRYPSRSETLLLLILGFFTPFLNELALAQSLDCRISSSTAHEQASSPLLKP